MAKTGENKVETTENKVENVENKVETTENKAENTTAKKYKALVSFSGLISMVKGQEKEIEDEYIVADLLKAKYIKEVK